ncbi:acyl carrier protein [Lachnospiraceae bacterium 47-T17]
MTEERKIELIEDLLEVDAGTISPEMQLEDVENWDSMTALALIVMIDEECGRRITGNDVKAMRSVRDIMNIMG